MRAGVSLGPLGDWDSGGMESRDSGLSITASQPGPHWLWGVGNSTTSRDSHSHTGEGGSGGVGNGEWGVGNLGTQRSTGYPTE
ncbi:hypothetical protein SARC_10476 [Sphaeroforma arctica JP610]|uniref:Uncharacterized protein n=1 Tax=Sphaeroforma arctica JP610 TaxID=667725 RepID=A0A0L0FKR4_9EUKA|nr:hypothetical protein SARC_10476 [Sphaeroforma arctica JP610]KNC77056.1 hypothetical protein SARC_10476 [Sphaeroforma arctica JP610]|eukprot:XP_014150958.1 hypothetical protein SARC_10476 [Sphaeroforma arctica JP610]